MTARLAAAIVLMLGAGTAAAAELGRLFFTPAQRATLDTLREKNIGKEAVSEKEPAPPLPQNVTLDGVVRRSDGKNTVWLNSRAVTAPKAGGIGVSTGKNDNRVRLRVPESGRSIDLKVGQTAEIVSGTIAENYSRRAPLPQPEAKPAPDAKVIPDAKAAPGAEQPASGTAKAAPGAGNTASGAARPAPSSDSQPAASESPSRIPSARARARDAEDDSRPRRGSETR